MKKLIALVALLVSLGASAGTDPMPRQWIELADGGKLLIRQDGTTYHVDAAGTRVRMRDGVVMQGKDGKRYVMKNDAIWRTIVERGTLHPNRP